MKKKIPQAIINKRFRRKLKSKEKRKNKRKSFQKAILNNFSKALIPKTKIKKSDITRSRNINYKEETDNLISQKILKDKDIHNYEGGVNSAEFESTFQFYQENLERQAVYGIRKCCYYFHNDDSINAAAIKNKKYYLIRINKGLMTHMIGMFKNDSELLNHQDLSKYSEFEEVVDSPNHILMYQNASHFVFYHELGHLIQFTGHEKKSLQEQLKNRGDFNLLSHLTEMDADEFAGISMASHISQYFSKYREIKNSDRLLNNLIVLTVSSIILYILSFPSNRFPLYFKEKTHPHPVIRVLSVAFTIISHLKELLLAHDIQIELNHVEVFKEALEVSKTIENEQWGSSLCDLFLDNVENNTEEINIYINFLRKSRIDINFMAVNRRNKKTKNGTQSSRRLTLPK